MSADGSSLCSIGWHGNLQVWDATTGKELKSTWVGYHPSHLALTPDFKFFASTTHVGGAAYGEIGAKEAKRKKVRVDDSAREVAISPTARFLPSATSTATFACSTSRGSKLPGPHVRGCWAVDLVLGKG